MRHYLGLNETVLAKTNSQEPVIYDPDALTTPHLVICGSSGSGKSYQSKRLLESLGAAGLQGDVFDCHDELDDIKDCKSVRYSQATGWGYNPLVLDTDPHIGGVNRQTDYLIGLISDAGAIGPRQKSALRNLIIQVYAAHNIDRDRPSSWRKNEITEVQRANIIKSGNLAQLRQFYPTLADLLDFTRRKIVALTAGTDNACVGAYEALAACLKKRNNANTAYGKALSEEDLIKLAALIEKLTCQCEELWSSHVRSMKTGEEPEDIIRFESAQMLASLYERIEILSSAGIFRANAPPFEDARIRVHQIKSLTDEQQYLFVKLRLTAIFNKVKALGPTTTGLRHVIFLDEAHKYFKSDPSDPINIIAKESRKFGLGLWCASQSPVEFPQHFMTNAGATMLLGIHPYFYKQSANMLRVNEETLANIRPTETLSIKMQTKAIANPPFMSVVVPNPKTDFGRRAQFAQARIKAA